MPAATTIALTGDVMLGRIVDETVAARGPSYPWGDLRPVLGEPHLVLVNLECAVTAQTREWTDRGARKTFYFRSEPDRGVPCLLAGRVAFASLANNHAGDYETAGLIETVEWLDWAGIAHAGAGRNLDDARVPALLDAAGLRLAVVAFADHPAAWAATATSPGINYLPISTAPPEMAVVAQAIAAARAAADLVVFSIHWGPNMRLRPTPEFRAFARLVIEAGADVFWGHSAHVVQGVEVWRGKPILYDTGDFVDDYAVDPELRNDLSALFLLRVAPSTIERLEVLPVKIARCRVNRAHGPDRVLFDRRFAELCAEFGTEVEGHEDRLEIRLADGGTPTENASPRT